MGTAKPEVIGLTLIGQVVRPINIEPNHPPGIRQNPKAIMRLNGKTVLVTAAHPNLGPVSLSMIGGGGTWGFTLPPATPGQIAGAATNNGFAVTDLPACAYTVTLETQVLLTTGDGIPGPLSDFVSFCKR